MHERYIHSRIAGTYFKEKATLSFNSRGFYDCITDTPPPTPLSWIHLFSLHSTRNSIFRRNSSVFMSLLVYIMHFIHRIYTEGLKHALYSYWIITGRECGWGWNKWNQELLEMKSSSELTITTILTKRNFKSTHLLIFILASYYLY